MKKIVLLLAIGLAATFANAQEKTSIKESELQKAITKHIAKTYVGYKTIEAYKIDTKDVITYEVVVEKGATKLNLYYDKNGKFLRKEAEKKAVNDKPKTTTKPNKTTKSPSPKK